MDQYRFDVNWSILDDSISGSINTRTKNHESYEMKAVSMTKPHDRLRSHARPDYTSVWWCPRLPGLSTGVSLCPQLPGLSTGVSQCPQLPGLSTGVSLCPHGALYQC